MQMLADGGNFDLAEHPPPKMSDLLEYTTPEMSDLAGSSNMTDLNITQILRVSHTFNSSVLCTVLYSNKNAFSVHLNPIF